MKRLLVIGMFTSRAPKLLTSFEGSPYDRVAAYRANFNMTIYIISDAPQSRCQGPVEGLCAPFIKYTRIGGEAFILILHVPTYRIGTCILY